MFNEKSDQEARVRGLRFFLSPHLFFFLFALFICGCGGSLSKAQVDRIRLHMTLAEVEAILGKGKPVESGEVRQLLQSSSAEEDPKAEFDPSELRGIRWGDDKKSVTVIFRSDRAIRVFPKGFDK
jgi:hypothetical protein